MTDKYKYGSISFRRNVLDNVRSLSTKILPGDGEKISSAKTFELGIKALEEKISNSESKPPEGNINAKNPTPEA